MQPQRSTPAPARRAEEPLAPELGTVLALDNVPVELPLARVGSRVLAGVIDYALLAVLVLLWSLAALLLGRGLGLRPGWAIAAWLLGMFVLDYGTFALQEALSGGRTLGKRVFRLRVVAQDGGAAGTGAFLVRNLVRTIPDMLVGVPLMAVDPLARRLGDRLAGTVVVHERPASELLLARLPAGWGAAEARLVESFLRRAGELDPSARLELARRLERWIEERAPGFLPGAPGEDPLPRLRAGFLAARAAPARPR